MTGIASREVAHVHNVAVRAAAPDLLAALKIIANYSLGSTIQPALIAREAIAKAEPSND